jgi:hypothetical protein
MATIPRNFFYHVFVASLFFTEFFYISVGNGVARIYHFIAAIVLIALLPKKLSVVLRSRVTQGLALFVCANFVAVAFSDSSSEAAISMMSLMANIGVAVAMALVLLRGRITIEQLYSLTMLYSVISVLWSLTQTVGVAVGIPLGLSPEQDTQIAIGFGPGFFKEANGFGKFLAFPFLLFLPRVIQRRHDTNFKLGFALIILGILINFTRSALIGMAIAAVYVVYSYFVRRRLSALLKRALAMAAIVGVCMIAIFSNLLPISDYAKFKMENILNREEIFSGVSSEYRVAALEKAWHVILSDPKMLLIGNGWGQLKIEVQGEMVPGGGNDLVHVMGFGGIPALLAYAFYSFMIFRAMRVATRRAYDEGSRLITQGFTFAFVGMFATAQLTGHLITPEYWLLVGVGIYFGAFKQRRRWGADVAKPASTHSAIGGHAGRLMVADQFVQQRTLALPPELPLQPPPRLPPQ